MKYKLLITTITLLILNLTIAAYGQDSLGIETPVTRELQVDFTMGYLKNNHNSLNSTLRNNGWGTVNDGFLTYSISAKILRGRFLFGCEWMGYNSDVKRENNLQTYMHGYMNQLTFGYAVIQKNGFRLYPYVGLNTSFSTLDLKDFSPTPDFASVWGGTRREAAIDFSSFALDLGIHGEKIFNLKNRQWDCPQNTRYLAFGFKVGYYLNLSESNNGRFNNERFPDSPTFNPSGFYGKLTLGFGSRIRQLKWK